MTRAATLITTAVATAALGLSACGTDGDGSNAANGSPRERAQEGALKFARCMRRNGVDMPDPQVGGNGLVKIGPGPGSAGAGAGGGPDDPAWRKADAACGKYLAEGGEAPSQEEEARYRDAFVAYARCMRGEGVNVPDPGTEGGMIFKKGDPNAPDPSSPSYQRADGVCKKHLGAIDAAVERTAP